MPASPLADRFQLANLKGPQPSDRTLLLLRRYDLAGEIPGDPRQLLVNVEKVTAAEPAPEKLYSAAEIAFLAAKLYESHDPDSAIDLYASSVAHAYRYLFDERCHFVRNPYDPQFRGACDLYNGALEGALRLWKARAGSICPGTAAVFQHAGQTVRLRVENRSPRWHDEDIGAFEFANDFDISGLTNHYRTFGLGVPLVVERCPHPDGDSVERHYPPKLAFPMTAFWRVAAPAQGDSAAGHHECVLELHDPLSTTVATLQRGQVPLESDLSTPLAYFLGQAGLDHAAQLGLLDPEKGQSLRGLYMIEPFDPRKIPVVMVHGLASSPMTWMEMFNDLRSEPAIRETFQFWFYMYPTGQPFWKSAAQMRQDMAELRLEVDPNGQLRTLDQMVLVGHSMGGLVSKLQISDSGDAVWHAVSDQSFALVKAEADERTSLEQEFFFRPNPTIKRVVTIGTPHRGSRFANPVTQWLGQRLIRAPAMQLMGGNHLLRENRELIRDPRPLLIHNSIDSLSPDNPLFPVLLALPRWPGVRLHNVVGVVEGNQLLTRVSGAGDGVVELTSAHLDDADSELVVNADHVHVHRHPRAVLEVRRILLEHARDVRTAPAPPKWPAPPVLYKAAQPDSRAG